MPPDLSAWGHKRKLMWILCYLHFQIAFYYNMVIHVILFLVYFSPSQPANCQPVTSRCYHCVESEPALTTPGGSLFALGEGVCVYHRVVGSQHGTIVSGAGEVEVADVKGSIPYIVTS